MGFLDRLLGREANQGTGPGSAWGSPERGYPGTRPDASGPARTSDEQAIERYRYLLRTAPPDQIEQAHREAFATLSPEQRSAVLAELSRELPPGERPSSADPAQLARAATRAEVRNPGTLERSFGRSGGPGTGRMGMGGMGMGGMGMGGMLAGGLLAGVAGAFIGSAVADAMFDTGLGDGGLFDTGADTEASGGFDGGGFDGGGFDGGDFGGDLGGF